MKKIISVAKVLKNVEINSDVKLLQINCPSICKLSLPGQFVHIKPLHSENFLRRPFSIADVEGNVMTIIYRIVGKGTEELANLRPKDRLSILGPIGNHFQPEMGRPLLVGGGVGIAPLIYLAKKLHHLKPILLIGGKNAQEVFWTEYLKPYAHKIYVTTDDGSVGHQGFTIDLMPQVLAAENIQQIYTCGPNVMMEAVAKIAYKHHIPCQVSLEKRMACAFGACLGCTFQGKLSGKRRKVCTEGPVFMAEEVF